MVFLYKKHKKKSFRTNILIYSLKLFDDFIFFLLLIKDYINIYNLCLTVVLKNAIYLLNIIAIKYILYSNYLKNLYIINYNYYNIYNIELFCWTRQSNIIYSKKYNYNNIEQKILMIKKISRSREKGRIRRYKIIILIGNKTGWFGIGYGKNYHLQEAISSARLNAFKNIYQVPLVYSNILKNNIYLCKKSKKLYLFSSNYKIKNSAHYFIRVLFEFIGINNISSKIIKIHNIYNILSLILKI